MHRLGLIFRHVLSFTKPAKSHGAHDAGKIITKLVLVVCFKPTESCTIPMERQNLISCKLHPMKKGFLTQRDDWNKIPMSGLTSNASTTNGSSLGKPDICAAYEVLNNSYSFFYRVPANAANRETITTCSNGLLTRKHLRCNDNGRLGSTSMYNYTINRG